jgi:DNA-binding XRE family transcriptional regulator
MKEYLVAIESDKTKEEIAKKLGVNVESIMTHKELEKKYILDPNQVIV